MRRLLRRRRAAIAAGALLALGLAAVIVRLDQPADPALVRFPSANWTEHGVVVDILDSGSVDAAEPSGLASGDVVVAVADHRLADGSGRINAPDAGAVLPYELSDGVRWLTMQRPDLARLVGNGWGNLVFVLALASLALAVYLRRPDATAIGPLLVAAAGLLGSTLTLVAGLPVLALAMDGAWLWLFHANTIGAYALAWGAVIAWALLIVTDHPWLRRGRRIALAAAYLGPLAVLLAAIATLPFTVDGRLERIGLAHAMTAVVVAAAQLVALIAAVVGYVTTADEAARARLRWVAGGGVFAIGLGLVVWLVPEVLTGRPLLSEDAIGLAGLPFIAGLGVALRRHHLFDIERLVNRSLVYGLVAAGLAIGYALAVAGLTAGLTLSSTTAAALAAAAIALGLAPLRSIAQRVVNRMLYGARDEPAHLLAELGARLNASPMPGDVPDVVVNTVARSLRLSYVAVDVTDEQGDFHPAAHRGDVSGDVHCQPLHHHGQLVGRLRVCGRSAEDPLDAVDLAIIGSLAHQLGPAIQAVRLHAELARSRAQLVALREDERRQLRRELHDGLGPSLAAIRLKAGLASRGVEAGSAARNLLDEISSEALQAVADVRRVVERLRPPALDELGLFGALTSRAASLSATIDITVSGPSTRTVLPAGVETAAYRIAVEAMTNAARHSGGSQCEVRVDVDLSRVEVTVTDDGGGVGDRPAGVGRRSMRERAAELGGSCEVLARPEGGTMVRARLPLSFGGA